MLNNTGLSQNSTTNRPTSHMLVYIGHVYAYGPKTEVTKRFFFESEVLDATLMMGWGGVGHVNVCVNLLRFLMLRWWWGGVGWGMLTFVWTCWGSWCYADDGVGWGMLTFVWTCWGSWCYADDGVGWGGVGHVNVRVNLLRFLMLRWWWGGVGWGMLTFVWTCWGSWCYGDDAVGWGGVGHVNVRVNLLRFLMLRWWWGGVGWGGVGHVNVRVNLLRFLMLRWWWGGVGWGMLTFVWTCWGSWCYADDGVGWGGAC